MSCKTVYIVDILYAITVVILIKGVDKRNKIVNCPCSVFNHLIYVDIMFPAHDCIEYHQPCEVCGAEAVIACAVHQLVAKGRLIYQRLMPPRTAEINMRQVIPVIHGAVE